MTCLQGDLKLFPFFSSPQETRHFVFSQWEEHSILIRAHPHVKGHLDLPRELIQILPPREALSKLSTGSTTNVSKRQADIVHTLAEVQGSAEPATIASLREMHVLSNGQKLFFLLLHCIT